MLAIALFANSLQGRLTGISIQSQREQAESQLRASMFNSLITPLGGSEKDGRMAPDREVLLTELLALNFHENFELKPLLEDAAKGLATQRQTNPTSDVDPRESLWSISRRIAERQKASVAREWETYHEQNTSHFPLAFLLGPWGASAETAGGCEVYFVTLDTSPRRPDIIKPDNGCQVNAAMTESVELKSPDNNYTLRMLASNPDWDNQSLKISIQAQLAGQPSSNPTDYLFALSWFDLPLTDNTLLPDGNRFAVYLRSFSKDFQKAIVTVMWFPKGYFTPRERPLNYTEVQQLLGTKQ
jgi:hypothetical protein